MANPEVAANYPNLIWEIVWINLSYGSPIIEWYAQNIAASTICTQKSLEETIKEQYPSYKDKTVHNAVYQLRRALKESPLGETLCQGIEVSKDSFRRAEFEDLSKEAVAYSLYKYAESRKIKTLRVYDLYKDDATGGLFKEFCVSKKTLEMLLRSLNSEMNRVLIAELNMGLDNITLRDDLNPISALSSLLNL